MEERINNKIVLCGCVTEEFVASEAYGEGFYEGKVTMKRYSGTEDVLPVVLSDQLVSKVPAVGERIAVIGEIRTYNKIVDGKSRLIVNVFAIQMNEPINEDINDVFLNGRICKPPQYRKTPFGREICDILLAVNRAGGKSDYIPCIVWGRNAEFLSTYGVNTLLRMDGRFQSREYKKTYDDGSSVMKTAYEVSGAKIIFVKEASDKDEKEQNQKKEAAE